MTKKLLILLGLVLALVATACTTGEGDDTDVDTGGEPALDATDAAVVDTDATPTDDAGGDTAGGAVLQEVQSRGRVRCGVNDAVPGFGFTTEAGEFEGFDIDFCRVIAAGVVGDPEAVDFVPLTAEQRFTALQSGEVDVLVRNTTWTATRDGQEGADFATTTFYDGQAMMVPADSEFQSLDDMDNVAICVLSGTTTELNLASEFNARGLQFEAITFEDNDQLIQAFQEGRCDGWTSDASQLAGVRSTWPEGPEALRILDEVFSKEPLGPAVREGEADWYDAVNWSVLTTIQAEEFGITSDNVQDQLESEDPNIRRFLGQPASEEEPTLDPGLGLPPDFAVTIIEEVGNYGEIYDRNVGSGSDLDLPRGLNELWTEGGLLYAPPYR